MNRRTVIQSLGLVTTHALFPSVLSGFLASCGQRTPTSGYSPQFFSPEDLQLLAKVIDFILPATRTASASATGTHEFMDEVFAKCLTSDQQQLIREGFSAFRQKWETSQDPTALLSDVDQKAFSGDESQAWFVPIKQYALVGFFTSQEGTTKASHYVPVPGDYKADIPVDDTTLNYGLTSQRYYL